MPARESAKCVECGTDNENGAVYCKNCGQKLVEPQKMCGRKEKGKCVESLFYVGDKLWKLNDALKHL